MKRNILARRAASAALAACMMFSLSAPALAASTDALLQQSTAAKSAVSVLDMQNDISESVTTMDLRNGSIIVSVENGQQYAEQKNIKQQISDLVVTTNNDETTNTLTIEGGTTAAKVTLHNVNIDASGAAVSVSGDVELIISGTNTLRSGEDRAGLEKADDDGTLTIDGTGSLEAYGGNEAAGIGSRANNNVRNIVINGGTITAECTGRDGAGIGGGHSGKAENIRINGGVVTATGGEWSYGIGSGYNEYSLLPTTITITGGTVKAIAGKPGAAIGALASANDLTMTGGSLTVQKFENSWGWIISPSSTIVEVDKNSLTGAITYLNQDGKVEDTANWDITVNETAVNGVNYKDILGDGALCYDIEKKTLTAKERINYVLKVRAPETDVILNGGIGARSSLTIGQQGDSSAVGAHDVTVTSDRYDAIQGEADINCTGKVNIRSDKSMAVNGSLNIYDSSEVTLSAGSNVVNGSANITSNGNVAIYSTVGRAAEKLTINNAENVTISIRDAAGAVSGDTKITASGTVTLKNNAQGGRVGTVAFTQAGGKNYVYYTSEEPDAKLIDPRIHPLAEAAGSRYLRIEPRETYSITVKNGTAQVGDDTTGLNTAFAGEKVTVSGKNENPSVTKFGGWKVISPESFELTEAQKNTEKNMTFTMPASPVELKASYSFPAPVLDMQVTVKDGTIRVGKGERQTGTVFVQPGQTVTIEANEPAKENESFHHWKVEKDSSKNIGIIEGSLGSETEKGTEKIVFTMPQDGVKLTAVYSIPASVLRSTVTVEGGTAKSTLGEGGDIPAEIGTTVEITATPYDAEKYPGMEFVEWEIKYPDSFYEKFPGGIPENLQLKLDNAKSAATTFEMPVYPVKLIAHWSASPVAKPDPDEPIDEDFGVEPAPMDTTGGTIAAVAVGGAAIWGGYEIATRVILHNLLPEGAAIPANRGQLALLIWTEKGKPEPAAQPAFADITDAEQAKAAQWCVEQGLLDAREGKFESDGWMPKFKTIEIWNKAFPKK